MENNFSPILEEKRKLRKEIKNICKTLNQTDITEMSKKVLENLKSTDIWKTADIIFAFLPLCDEVDTRLIIKEALAEGKRVAVPRIDGSDIFFHYITSLAEEEFSKHNYGMHEPLQEAEIAEIDGLPNSKILILTPGMAFDSQCCRLGRGKSFYDRFFPKCGQNCVKVGIAFNFQITEKVPLESHDVTLDFVITDKNIYNRAI